jgi:hypothetical protein
LRRVIRGVGSECFSVNAFFEKGLLGGIRVKSAIKFDFWACQRPLTHRWGSGQVFVRITKQLGPPDVAFGKTDGIPDDVLAVDKELNYDWIDLPYPNNHFNFGYWDPPYDHLYKKEGIEIWRTCKRLAILHTHIWPRAWLKGSIREAMIAVTMGSMKQIRCLQVFRKELPP